jgi:Flp pilus assembly protein TadD
MSPEDLLHQALVVPPDLAARLDRIGLEFLADVLEIEVARRPENDEALGDLGHVLTRLGRNARALEVDRELVRRNPQDETVHYNLACSLALVGEIDAALDALERACTLGYDDADHAESDEDLAPLREHARFQALLARLRAPRES